MTTEITDHKGRTIRRPDGPLHCPLCGSDDIRGLWALQDVANLRCENCETTVNIDFAVSNDYGFIDQ